MILEENGSIRILVVDDNKSSRDILEDLFIQQGYDVLVASDGLEAISCLKEAEIDLVLTDLKMPGADGLQVLRESIRINPDIMVVIITGYASLDSAIESMREGAYDYVKKPFDLEEILLLAQKASDRIHLIRENRDLTQRLYSTQSDMEILMAKKEEIERELKRMTKKLAASQKESLPEISLLNDLPSNLLPYQNLIERKGSAFDALHALAKIGEMKKNGLLEEEEFRILKQKLIFRV